MTVSNVLNRRPNVRPSTRDAVLKAISDLGYKPNAAARSLASATTTRIGLICGSLESGFLSSIFSGTIEETSELGVQLLMHRVDRCNIDEMVEAMAQFERAGAGAVLSHPPYCEALSASGRDLPLPMVAISAGDELANMSSVRVDDRAAAREMTAYLASLGHRRIGLVRLSRGVRADVTRFEGYCEALDEAGLAFDPALVVQGDLSFESGRAAARELLERTDRPTAIFASSDELAAGVISVAHRMGLDIPRDLSVAGFDDGPLALKIWPTMTTIHQPVAAMAGEATRLAVAVARDPGRATEITTTLLGHRLIVRESTGPSLR